MKIKTIILASFFFLLTACAEPIEESRLDYVGSWTSNEMALLILQDGSVSYRRIKKGANVSVNGPLKEFVGDDFVVGVLFLTTTFKVTEPPHKVNGVWEMVVDGVRLRKQES